MSEKPKAPVAAIDFSGFQPKPPPGGAAQPEATENTAPANVIAAGSPPAPAAPLQRDTVHPRDVASAEAAGFVHRTSRVPVKEVDGRTLRRSGRTKHLAMKVRTPTHTRFWEMVKHMGFRTGEDLLTHLMSLQDRDEEQGRNDPRR